MDAPTTGDPLPALGAADELAEALDRHRSAVLVAPPGTGKTTGLPPLLVDRPWMNERLVLVVPRRIAARAAAARMAALDGGAVGERFGYTVRHDRRVSAATMVEVVTPGILLARIQSQPDLEGVSAVVLDEFHERSVDLDLLAALLVDVRSSLRPDLRLLVMSATIDAAPIAELLAGPASEQRKDPVPVIRVEAPPHPIETHWRPGSAHDRIEDRVTDVVLEALSKHPGDILVFLPGRAEISGTAGRLAPRVSDSITVSQLHGSLDPRRQDEILDPPKVRGRRVILSTSLAETSVTVPGVRVVVDAGRRRYVAVDPRADFRRS